MRGPDVAAALDHSLRPDTATSEVSRRGRPCLHRPVRSPDPESSDGAFVSGRFRPLFEARPRFLPGIMGALNDFNPPSTRDTRVNAVRE